MYTVRATGNLYSRRLSTYILSVAILRYRYPNPNSNPNPIIIIIIIIIINQSFNLYFADYNIVGRR